MDPMNITQFKSISPQIAMQLKVGGGTLKLGGDKTYNVTVAQEKFIVKRVGGGMCSRFLTAVFDLFTRGT